jgi:hypothetical protein
MGGVLSIGSGTNRTYCTYSLNILLKYLKYARIYLNISLSGGRGREGLLGVTGRRAGVQTTRSWRATNCREWFKVVRNISSHPPDQRCFRNPAWICYSRT